MKFIIGYLKPFFGRMTVGFTIKVIGTVVELALPYLLSHILKTVVLSEKIGDVFLWGVLMILCALMACVCNVVANRMAARVSCSFAERMRHDLFERMLYLSARQTDKFTIPSLETRITSDTYNVHHFVGMMQRLGVRAPILLTGGIIITLMMDSFLALTMILMLPLIFVTVLFITRRGLPLYTKVQQASDRMIGVVREDVQGIRVIKALSKGEYEHRRYDNVNKELSDSERKVGRVMGAVNPVMNLFMNFGLVAVVALSANRVAGNLSDPETVVAFIQYFTMISMAMISITRMFNMFTRALASSKRINEVLETEEEIKVHSREEYKDAENDAFIEFRNVSFTYNGKRNNLDNVSFTVNKGESLGIIGATGSGKSTVVKLLLRFYDVDSGAIYVNGRDIRTYTKSELYAMFGTVMQQDFLYADTVKENILFGRDATDDELITATRIAQAYDFITSFDEGFERELAQKGTNLSGGQKQRLLIARAILKRPQILVLDDSSSALDYKTDALLRQGIKEMDTTLITVAQRVSSVKNADVIILLDEGKVIGRGTHDELLAESTEYKEISDSQMGGAFVE